jgi:hypothetical protein
LRKHSIEHALGSVRGDQHLGQDKGTFTQQARQGKGRSLFPREAWHGTHLHVQGHRASRVSAFHRHKLVLGAKRLLLDALVLIANVWQTELAKGNQKRTLA